MSAWLRLLRPHQWAKNLLVFTALLTAHRWADAASLAAALRTFTVFCLAASAIYVHYRGRVRLRFSAPPTTTD